MSTKKRRIATYIPTEIEDKFQAFKKERKVGDSQALILILTEFLGVSQNAAHSSDLLEQIKSELLCELKSELLREVEALENKLGEKIDELRSELPNELSPEVKPENAEKTFDQQELGIPAVQAPDSSDDEKGLKGVELAKRLNYDNGELGRKAKKSAKEDFANWSKERDPEGIPWERRENKKYYPLPTSLSEEGAEAQSSHPKGLAF